MKAIDVVCEVCRAEADTLCNLQIVSGNVVGRFHLERVNLARIIEKEKNEAKRRAMKGIDGY